MRVDVVDPSAYTPPYDHALCAALAQAGAAVRLCTSRFAYGPVPAPEGYERRELFYRHARGAPASRVRLAAKLLEHVPDMLTYRRLADGPGGPDVVHFQWLPVQQLDGRLLPRRRPLVLTAHDVMPREPRPGQLAAQRRLYGRFDAILVHSRRGRERLVAELGVPAERIRVIPHGGLTHVAAEVEPAAGAAAHETRAPVVLCFGLIRPYKGIDVLLEAWRGIDRAELWIAGMPRMDMAAVEGAVAALNARADQGGQGRVRLDARFIPEAELPRYFARADLVVLPYREIDQSGVLFTALALGKPLLLSDAGGFPEIAATGAAETVPVGDPAALREAIARLLADRDVLARMSLRAREAARGPYSWSEIARSHLRLYEELLSARP